MGEIEETAVKTHHSRASDSYKDGIKYNPTSPLLKSVYFTLPPSETQRRRNTQERAAFRPRGANTFYSCDNAEEGVVRLLRLNLVSALPFSPLCRAQVQAQVQSLGIRSSLRDGAFYTRRREEVQKQTPKLYS